MMSNILNEYFRNYYDSEMLYNKIDYDFFNIDKFNEKYNIIKLSYNPDKKEKKQWISYEDEIFAEMDKYNDILSVSFTGGRVAYILIYKDSFFNIDEILKKEEYKRFNREEFYISESCKSRVEEKEKLDIAYNLLLNALAGKNNNYSNLNGGLYVHVRKEKNQIITMNYYLKRGLLLRKQQTFKLKGKKSEEDNNKKDDNKANNSNEPKEYIIKTNGNNIEKIIRKDKNEENEKDVYIKGSIEKTLLKYDDLSIDKPKTTRVKLLHDMIDVFNFKYKGIAKLEFVKIPIKSTRIKQISQMKKEKYGDFNELNKVNIVVAENLDSYKKDIKEIVDLIKTFNIDVVLSNKLEPNEKNIFIIHDEEHYKSNKINDIKKDFPSDMVIQGMTVESLYEEKSGKLEKISLSDIKCIVEKLLSELVIKQGLKERKLKNWSFGKMEFYLALVSKKELGKEAKHILMKVNSDGSFNIIDDINEIESRYTKYINELKKKDDEYNDGNICIVCKNDEMNQIIHTDYVPVLDKETKEKHIKESKDAEIKTRTRNKKYKYDKLAFPYIGKSVMIIDNAIHYTVGLDDNPKVSIPTINNIYKIKQLLNDEDEESKVIPEILDMLRDYHVRGNSTESVRPFPFKYMLEYIRINNPGKSIYLK